MSGHRSSTDDEPSSSKKRTRGVRTYKKLVKGSSTIEFDNDLDQHLGENAAAFSSHMGTLARTRVCINIKNWKRVNKKLKKTIWQELKDQWQIPNDKHKKVVMKEMGVLWRRFKNFLTTHYVRTGKSPLAVYEKLKSAQWNKFVKYRQSDEFKALSKKAKDSQAKNVHPHFLGSRGYHGKKFQQLVASNPLALSTSCESIGPLSKSANRRTTDWLYARGKLDNQGSFHIPHESTREVAQKIGLNHERKSTAKQLDASVLPNKKRLNRVDDDLNGEGSCQLKAKQLVASVLPKTKRLHRVDDDLVNGEGSSRSKAKQLDASASVLPNTKRWQRVDDDLVNDEGSCQSKAEQLDASVLPKTKRLHRVDDDLVNGEGSCHSKAKQLDPSASVLPNTKRLSRVDDDLVNGEGSCQSKDDMCDSRVFTEERTSKFSANLSENVDLVGFFEHPPEDLVDFLDCSPDMDLPCWLREREALFKGRQAAQQRKKKMLRRLLGMSI